MSRSPVAVLLVAAVTLLGGCGGRVPEPEPVGDAPLDDQAPTTAAPVTAPASPARVRELTVERAAIDRVLAAGPGRFLATFEVRARVVAGRFAGWQLVRAPWPTLDLLPGDVVLRANRRTLERPLELESLWTELGRADALVVDVERGGERFTVRVAIARPTMVP